MKYWLIKSEPDAFSIADLKKAKTEPWDGIRNYQARNFMRDGMSVGDLALFDHSNTEVPGVVGIAEVASECYPDPTQYNARGRETLSQHLQVGRLGSEDLECADSSALSSGDSSPFLAPEPPQSLKRPHHKAVMNLPLAISTSFRFRSLKVVLRPNSSILLPMKIMRQITNLFWLWTILGTAWAWVFPEHFVWFLGKFPGTELKLTALGLGVIMLGMGITLTLQDFAKVLEVPWKVAVGVAAQFLLMPAIGWSVATLFALPDQLKLGLILVSCCPGGTASNVVCYLARANVALSVLMTMTSTMLAIGLTPYLTKVYASAILEVDAMAMVWTMVTIVLFPVVGGVLLNRYLGPKLRVVKEISPVISVLVIVLIVGAIVGVTKENIVKYAATLLPAVFLVHASGFAFGYLWGKLFKFGVAERRTVSIEVGMQNSGLGSELAKTHFTMLAAAPCAISAFYHCIIGSFLASLWRRKGSPDDGD